MGALLWSLLLLLQEAKGFSGDDEDPEEVVGVLQESINLSLEIPSNEEIKHIDWLFQNNIAIVKPGKKGTASRYHGSGSSIPGQSEHL